MAAKFRRAGVAFPSPVPGFEGKDPSPDEDDCVLSKEMKALARHMNPEKKDESQRKVRPCVGFPPLCSHAKSCSGLAVAS